MYRKCVCHVDKKNYDVEICIFKHKYTVFFIKNILTYFTNIRLFFSLNDLLLNQVMDKSGQSYLKWFIFQPHKQRLQSGLSEALLQLAELCPQVKLAENWHDNDTKNPFNFQNKAPQAAFKLLCCYYINIASDKLEEAHRETTQWVLEVVLTQLTSLKKGFFWKWNGTTRGLFSLFSTMLIRA